MKEGDWTPAAFSDCDLATLANDALSATDHLIYELINSGRGGGTLLDSISRSDAHFEVSLAGGDWRMTATSTRRYEHFDHKIPNAEPVIAGVGKESQTQLKGRVTKWVKLTKLPREREHEYQRRLQSDKENIKKYRSHLLLAKRFDTSGARLVALASEKQFIGYGWMPVLGKEPITFEFSKAIVIWLNSTPGRLALRRVSGAKISFPQLSPINFDAVPFVDIRNTDAVRVPCEGNYILELNKPLKPCNKLYTLI